MLTGTTVCSEDATCPHSSSSAASFFFFITSPLSFRGCSREVLCRGTGMQTSSALQCLLFFSSFFFSIWPKVQHFLILMFLFLKCRLWLNLAANLRGFLPLETIIIKRRKLLRFWFRERRIMFGRDADQSLCAHVCTQVASLQRSTFHVSNGKFFCYREEEMNVEAESEWGQMNIVKGKEAEFVFCFYFTWMISCWFYDCGLEWLPGLNVAAGWESVKVGWAVGCGGIVSFRL